MKTRVCPDVSRNHEGLIIGFKKNFQEIPGIKSQDGTTVRGDVSDGRKLQVKTLRRVKISKINQIVVFACPVIFL